MAYASASDVIALCRNLVGSASGFDTSTSPTLTQVNVWLSSGCAMINAVLGSYGYDPIPTSSAAYDLALEANALYAAWLAERSRINARITSDERTRADMFKRDFEYHLDWLSALDLSALGVTQTSAGGRPYAGGISRADKDTVNADADRVPARFARGAFRNKEAPSVAHAPTWEDEQARN